MSYENLHELIGPFVNPVWQYPIVVLHYRGDGESEVILAMDANHLYEDILNGNVYPALEDPLFSYIEKLRGE